MKMAGLDYVLVGCIFYIESGFRLIRYTFYGFELRFSLLARFEFA